MNGLTPDSGMGDLVALLQRASDVLDRAWHSAVADPHSRNAMALLEASYDVHRALIALGGEPGEATSAA